MSELKQALNDVCTVSYPFNVIYNRNVMKVIIEITITYIYKMKYNIDVYLLNYNIYGIWIFLPSILHTVMTLSLYLGCWHMGFPLRSI